MGNDRKSKNRTFDRLAVIRKLQYILFLTHKNYSFLLIMFVAPTRIVFEKDFPSLFIRLLFIHDEKISLHCRKVRRCEYQITRWKYCFVYLTKGSIHIRWMICIVFVIWKENKHTYSSVDERASREKKNKKELCCCVSCSHNDSFYVFMINCYKLFFFDINITHANRGMCIFTLIIVRNWVCYFFSTQFIYETRRKWKSEHNNHF